MAAYISRQLPPPSRGILELCGSRVVYGSFRPQHALIDPEDVDCLALGLPSWRRRRAAAMDDRLVSEQALSSASQALTHRDMRVSAGVSYVLL